MDPVKYTYSLDGAINGHALLSLSYSAKKWSLIGSWNATVGPMEGGAYDLGQFPLGGRIDFEALKKAVILSRKPNKNKSWNLSGSDIARLLDRTAPDPSRLPAGGVNTLVAALCEKCGVPCSVTQGLPSSVVADARALVSATKAADIIVELAQLSGCLAYIDISTGTLKFSGAGGDDDTPSYTDGEILENGGDELDLDNYAKGVCVILHRKKNDDEDEGDPEDPPGHYFYGLAPPGLSTESFSGEGISGSKIMPLNLPVSLTSTTNETVYLSDSFQDPKNPGSAVRFGSVEITVETAESFEYGRGHRTNEGTGPAGGAPNPTSYGPSYRDYWDIPRGQEGPPHYNGNTQHREYKWVEKSHRKTTVVTKEMTGPVINITVRETTTEETERTFDSGCLLTKETYSSRTTREFVSSSWGNSIPDNIKDLFGGTAPDFNEETSKEFQRAGNVLMARTTRKVNEQQEVGKWSPVLVWNQKPGEPGEWEPKTMSPGDSPDDIRPLAVKAVTFPAPVQHVKVETDKEFFGDNGEVAIKTHGVVSDGGGSYVLAKGWIPLTDKQGTGLAYAVCTAFSSQSAEASVSMEGGSPSDDIIQSETYEGVTWYWDNVPGGDSWYDPATGGYAQRGGACPHYSGGNCNIAGIDVIWDYTERKCPNRNGENWSGCPRALAALENQKAGDKDAQFAPPIVCHSDTYPAPGTYEPVHFRNVYIRDDIPGGTREERDEAAAAIGVTLANNLLRVYSRRGWVRTVTVPLDTSVHISGTVMSVSHDFKAKKTTLTYRVGGEVPDFLNSNSPQSMSFYIWERENNRNTRSVIGKVLAIESKSRVRVQVGDGEIMCSSNIISLKAGDSVLISLPAGNRMDGTIEERV
ncbi:MAG: hypothetical protein LBL26_06195 [Peptococcaceae bacterium]|jgi:hypothetical protein|nr:hypothetical protein [Peptococcaceae bacterium]